MKKLEIKFTEEQAMMLETAKAFCQEKSPNDKVRDLLNSDKGYDEAVWQAMAELGWQGMTLPEEYGGSGLGIAELVTVVEPMGQYLLASPLTTSTIAAQALLVAGSEAQKQQWLPQIADGSGFLSIAINEPHGDWNLENISCTGEIVGGEILLSGTKTFVAYADHANALLATVMIDAKPALVLIDQAQLQAGELSRETVIDETRRSFRLTLDGIKIPTSALIDTKDTIATLQTIRHYSYLTLAAEMSGGMQGVLDVTVEYLKIRTQFGRLIGSYQGLKHPMADILCQHDFTRSHLYYAASVCAAGDDVQELEIALRMAKAQASESFYHAGDRAIQFHGGIGFTYECDAQLYLRRASWCQYQFGDALHHRKRLAELML